MKRFIPAIILVIVFLSGVPITSEANPFPRCPPPSEFDKPKHVYKLWTQKVGKKRWETRFDCLPCGRKIPYRVKLVKYRTRYSNGSIHEWDCVIEREDIAYTK